jgi:hypothetical protein
MCARLPKMVRPVLFVAVLAVLAGCVALLSGCGKGGTEGVPGGGPLRKLAPVAEQGAVSVTTRNTTRVGGASTAVDAAAVARVAYSGLTAGSRPEVVVLVDQRNWPAALSASVLAGAPLHAPILFTEGKTLPPVSLEALEAMHPLGASSLGGAQVIEIGTHALVPKRFSVTFLPAGDASESAARVERLFVSARARVRPQQAIVLSVEGQRSLQMPAAGLAAESATPLVLLTGARVPHAAAAELGSLHHPSIYVMNAAQLSRATLGELARLGRVTNIPGPAAGEAPGPASSAIAVARFTDGSFGWGVKEPGHGLVFANSERPLDAPAAALLSATADYGPLLLLEKPGMIPAPLAGYLGDIQPAYSSAPEFQPVRGVYNHGWLIGDERAITPATQSELDSLLEISPTRQTAEAPASQPE